MLILMNINNLDMVLHLIHKEVFCYLMVVGLVQARKIFDADMSSSAHVDNKKKDILILVKAQYKGQTIVH